MARTDATRTDVTRTDLSRADVARTDMARTDMGAPGPGAAPRREGPGAARHMTHDLAHQGARESRETQA